MCHKALAHVMMPTPPRTCFVVIQSHLALALGQQGFNWPAHTAQAGQVTLDTSERRITQVEFEFGLRSQAATEHRPYSRTRQAVADRGHAQKSKLSYLWPFASFFERVACPSRRGQS